MKIFCIDIGNTHAHFGVVSHPDADAPMLEIPTDRLDQPGAVLSEAIGAYRRETPAGKRAYSFCSVVPAATERLRSFFAKTAPGDTLFQLTFRSRLGMAVTYPKPEEIGQDRLANAVAATAFHPLPCIVIDLGTAVTFDIVTASGGYEGGIIAPGLRIMTQYLHEQTAQLPFLGDQFDVSGAIGKSTSDAMKIGCSIGFGGMIRALLEAVAGELTRRGETTPHIINTGGTARFLGNLHPWKPRQVPDLTLQGLAHAWKLNHSPTETVS